jgi:hypothetical protein
MSEGYEERGLEKAQNSRSSIRNRLTTDIGRFCLYNPVVPNMQLPHEPDCVNLRCVQKREVAKPPPAPDSKGAFLARNESHAMGCCFGKKLKFKRVRLNSRKNQFDGSSVIISHSAESGILAFFSEKKQELGIPQTIEDEVSKLFAVEQSSDDEKIVGDFANSRNSDDQDDSDAVCVPLSMHLMTDDDDGRPPNPPRTFLSDDDDDDRTFLTSDDEDEELLAQVTQGRQKEVGTNEQPKQRPPIDIGSDSDDLDIVALMPAPAKKPQIFLDSDDDNDYISVT